MRHTALPPLRGCGARFGYPLKPRQPAAERGRPAGGLPLTAWMGLAASVLARNNGGNLRRGDEREVPQALPQPEVAIPQMTVAVRAMSRAHGH